MFAKHEGYRFFGHPPLSNCCLNWMKVTQEQKNDDEKKAYCNKQAFETKRKTKAALVRINSEGRESPEDH